MYAITLHQPWASLIALGIKTVETRSWPAPARLIGQTIAIHAGKRAVRKPGVAVENEMRARLGEDWHRTIPAGAVLATATLSGMARVERVDPRAGLAVHDLSTEAGCAVGLGQTRIDPGGDFNPGRWLCQPRFSRRREDAAATGSGRWPSIILALACCGL